MPAILLDMFNIVLCHAYVYIPAWGSPEELKSFHPSNDEIRN